MINKQYKIEWKRLNSTLAFALFIVITGGCFAGCKTIQGISGAQYDVDILLTTKCSAAEINDALLSVGSTGIYFDVVSDNHGSYNSDYEYIHIRARIHTDSDLHRFKKNLSLTSLPIHSCSITKVQ
jgi:hypothetical protein